MASTSDYHEVAHGIARYLASRQQPDGAFPGPDHYGRAFAALLWSNFGEDFARHITAAFAHLRERLPADHGEFNAFALLQTIGAEDLLPRLRFGHRHSANWMLLRAVCRSRPGPWFSPRLARLTARAALLRYGRDELIYDRPGALSHTYHSFCGALLADLGQNLGWPWAEEQAGRAARAMLPHLAASEALQVGRGAGQVFGYGALLYLLEHAGFHGEANRVFTRLLRFRRDDGSFPLVLNANEPPDPWQPDPSPPGWYDYNRYADYLPFLGVYLVKAGRAS